MNNKDFISKQKTKRTMTSINMRIKDSYGSRNSNFEDNLGLYTNTYASSPMQKLRFGEKKNSISFLNKPNISSTKIVAIDAYSNENEPEKDNVLYDLISLKESTNKATLTSNLKFTDRNLSSSSIKYRSKSNASKARHFQIKHEPSKLNSLTSFQKLVSNFPEIKSSSAENLNSKGKKHFERYMSSDDKVHKNLTTKNTKSGSKACRELNLPNKDILSNLVY